MVNEDNKSLMQMLNDKNLLVRIDALELARSEIQEKNIKRKQDTVETNNHIHTKFSFSPYYPALAAFLAWKAGLQTVGSIDHDSFAAAREMKSAGNYLGIGTTVGFELRVDFSSLGFGDRTINNPDSKGIAYVVCHGIPLKYEAEVKKWLKPINHSRNARNVKMVSDLNFVLSKKGIDTLNFEKEVVTSSEYKNGGSITERHILAALSNKLIESIPSDKIVNYLSQDMGVKKISSTLQAYVSDEANPHRMYDLLGVLKSSYLPQFFIQPNNAECIDALEFLQFSDSVEGISTYAYLGDVAVSSTGDKKEQKFEDNYLDILMPALKEAGFKAIAYMIPRNTKDQINRIRDLCEQYVFMEINGVDLNSSRQSINCPQLSDPAFSYLADSAWALVGHEYNIATGKNCLSFDPKQSIDSLNKQIKEYAEIGKESVRGFRL